MKFCRTRNIARASVFDENEAEQGEEKMREKGFLAGMENWEMDELELKSAISAESNNRFKGTGKFLIS